MYYWLLVFINLVFGGLITNAVTNFTFGTLTIWLYAENIIRITHLPNNVITKPSVNSRIVNYTPTDVPYNQNGNVITTKKLMIKIDSNNNNAVSFYDALDTNIPILSEESSTFRETTDAVTNNPTFIISQQWNFSDNDTAIYGFGSYQNDFIDYRDTTIRCVQFILESCVPFLISSNFYGILWDNYAISTLNYNTNIITNYTLYNDSNWMNFSIKYTSNSQQNGYHHFFLNFTNEYNWGGSYDAYYSAKYMRSSDTSYTLLIEHGPSHNMPSSASLPGIYLKSGETIQLIICLQNFYKLPTLSVRGVTNMFDIHSLEADYIDYYFAFDKNDTLDGVINSYRMLTGKAPLYELKNYGFWQCQQRYHNQSEILESAAQFRSRGVPVDNIVQDWLYWGPNNDNWGPQWDPTIYPYPDQMVNELHAMNYFFMVSVWTQYGTNTTFYKQMQTDNELIYPNTSWVDIYQQSASQQFYLYAKQSMFNIHVDALWLDGTEPASFPMYNHFVDNQTLSGNAIFNPYSLYVTKAIYDGLSSDYPNKRIFSLSISSFAAQQRFGGAYWTGDTTATWDALHRQIVSSINYGLSGLPYWSQDIGAFYRPNDCYTNPEYLRMLIRWFQFGAFAPIFRVHGNNVQTAIWYYGETVFNDVLLIDNLRYRLIAYIYSVSYYVDRYSYTLQRALILEFPHDINVKYINDQFMFGPNLLISPVTNDNNMTDIYLPKTQQYDKYYDFWNGSTVTAGKWYYNQYVELSKISIYVPCGSIILMAPYLKWVDEIPWDPIEVRIYRGNDANFVLFEDDGVSKNSIIENQYTEIEFIWTDSNNTLTITERKGSYDQMITERFFNIVLVAENHGTGVNVTNAIDKIVSYVGKKVVVYF